MAYFLTGAPTVAESALNASVSGCVGSLLRPQNSGLPISRLGDVKFAQSSKERLIQLSHLVAGAVRRSVEGAHVPLRESNTR
jgi:hypothetical protein